MRDQGNETGFATFTVKLEQDQYVFLEEIAKGLRVGIDAIVANAVISSILGSAYPKDEARIQYVTMEARVDKWRRSHIAKEPTSSVKQEATGMVRP